MIGVTGDIEERLGKALRQARVRIATAESCTGGLIANRITNVAGSSAYFQGGAVAYSNEAKASLLGVNDSSLEWHGAVSEVVAREMAQGAKERLNAEYAIACTGIAGPGGGTLDKPVGLVFIGIAAPYGVRVHRYRFAGDRMEIKRQTAETAMQLALEAIE